MPPSLIKCLKKYADFSGRATRTEYWIFHLATLVFTNIPAFVGMMLALVGEENGNEIILAIGALFIVASNFILFLLMIPGLAVSVRRLHDVGKSGNYLYAALIPIIGPIIVLLTLCEDSQPGSNQYGVSEKYP